jgi:PAS domain S-box-containing protein
MLADVLDGARDHLVGELERRAMLTEPTGLLTAGGRRDRLDALVQELIETLRGGLHRQERSPLGGTDATREEGERELVKRYVIEKIEQKQLDASPRETALVAEWAGHGERERIAEQNRRLRALLDRVQQSAVLLSPDGRILYGNLHALQSLHDYVGISGREVIGKTPAELGVPDDLVAGHKPTGELLSMACARASFETTAGGRAKETQLDAVYRPDGTVGAIGVVIRDVHERKLTQLRLTLLTKLSTLVGLRDRRDVAEALVQVPIPELADWCIVNLVENGQIQRTYVGHRNPAKTYLRDALMKVIPRDNHPLWQEMLTGGFQLLTEVSDDLLRKLTDNDEQYRMMAQVGLRSLMVVPMVSRGKVSGIITCGYTAESNRRYGRDDPPLIEEVALHAAHAFENARLVKELKASEARFRVALAGARTAVYEQDTSLRYVWCYNPMATCDLVGKTQEEAYPPDEAALLTRVKRRALERGETVSEEMDLTFGGPERRHYREAIEPIRNQAGKIVGIIGAATDLTDQQQTRHQLTDELDFRERMMGILGHDLRGPLTAITMAGDLLLRRSDLSGAPHDQVQRIRRASARMKEMIDTLLDFTRARFLGRIPVSPVPADLGEIARGAVDELHTIWPDYPIDVDVHGDPRGEWDPARMAQTVCNLVSNAITYGQRGTTVQVSVNGDGGEAELKVHNDGPPIPPELIPELFHPFHRGAPDDRSPWGMGLGLYIVDQLVQAHDGTVAVQSTAEEGTTFTVRLPRAHAPAPQPAARAH